MKYQVIEEHLTNYPDPIVLQKGEVVKVGERYKGPENWNNWIYCYTLDGRLEGWVPEQLLDMDEDSRGRVLEEYTAKELNVQPGERVTAFRELNGWRWCQKEKNHEEGWVPKEKLKTLKGL